jgi:hypothetical protein
MKYDPKNAFNIHVNYKRKSMLTPQFDLSGDNFRGDITAPIEIVKYGDYQCPH